MSDVSDVTVGYRLCLLCGRIYHGRHSKCPHKNAEIVGVNQELARVLYTGLNL